MSVLVWVHDHIVWLALGIVPCAAAIGWGLWAGRYHPAHAGAGPVPERLWPLVGDPRAGSMILAEERDLHLLPPQMRDNDLRAPYPPFTSPLDWREVAHEGDWRAQTAADLAPATLDSGPGGPSLAPGPDWLRGPEQPHEKPAGTESAGSGHLDEPEAGWTVAGRLVETSDEWLRRLVANAAPGWTYAGTVAA